MTLAPVHPLPQIDRDRAAQVGAASLDPRQAPALQYGAQTTHRCLHLGQFRHGGALADPRERRYGSCMSDTVSFGYTEVSPTEKTAKVGEVFARVAQRYDIMNDAMSGGMHRLWKDRFVARVKPRAGERILDMAGGTGDIAFRLARRGAHVTVSDINPAMLEVGQGRATRKGIDGLDWSEQNAETLSFGDTAFDAYTIAFGIRNVTHIAQALAEAHRVLKRGGRFFCLEFSTTLWPGFAQVYDAYSHRIVPKLGKLIAQDEDSYRYLIESIRRFPDMERFKAMIGEAGFVQAKAEPILGGLVAIHSGWKI